MKNNTKYLINLLDKGLILLIFLVVFTFDFSVGGMPLRNIVLALLFFLSLLISPHEITKYRIDSFYIKVFFAYSILVSYSVLRDNNIENMVFYLKPLLMLLIIPTFSILFRNYGINRYLKVFFIACIFLILLFLYIFIRSSFDPGWGLALNDKQKFITVVIYDMPRVIMKSFVFIVPALLIGFYSFPRYRHLLFVVFLIISVLSQTYGIVGAVIVMYLIFLVNQKKYTNIIAVFFISLFLCVLYENFITETLLGNKMGSVDAKSEQMMNITKDMEGIDFLLGRGIGVKFRNFDSRGKTDQTLEVAGVVVFQSCGFLFSFLLLYSYLIPAIWAYLKFRKNTTILILSFSQIGILVTSFSNPYIWSGGVGYTFISMIIAYTHIMLYNNGSKIHKQL